MERNPGDNMNNTQKQDLLLRFNECFEDFSDFLDNTCDIDDLEYYKRELIDQERTIKNLRDQREELEYDLEDKEKEIRKLTSLMKKMNRYITKTSVESMSEFYSTEEIELLEEYKII
jgi:septal ring factor EnvC (AmiA/AmiB activator)